MKRLIPLVLLAGCMVTPEPKTPGLKPDIVSAPPYFMPIYIRGESIMGKAPIIAAYVDAAQKVLEQEFRAVERGRVVVVPYETLYNRSMPVPYKASNIEIRIEWHSTMGAYSYPRARLAQAGYTESAITKKFDVLNRAAEAGRAATR